MKQKSIPDYFVYGEEVRVLEPGFMHVELVSARKSEHRGRVAAHKHPDMAQITYWFKGSGTYLIEDKSWIFSAPALSFTPSHVVHGFDVTDEADAVVLSIATDALDDIVEFGTHKIQPAFFTAQNESDEHWATLKWVMQNLQTEYQMQVINTPSALAHLAGLAYVSALRLRNSQVVAGEPLSPSPLAQRLRTEINAGFRENWPVQHYVKKLGTTYHLLEKACLYNFGTSIKAIIVQRRLLEAKRLLKFSIRSSESIAFELGFKDSAYFNREFKKHTGLAPGLWRKGAIKNQSDR